MKNGKKILLCVLLAFCAVFCVATGFGCAKKDESTNGGNAVERKYQKGEEVLLNGFESYKDLYAIKQINAAYDSVGSADISEAYKSGGKSSLKYTYVSGGNPLLLQRTDRAENKDLDFAIVGAVSASVYNDSNKTVTVSLRIIINGNVAVLSSEEYEIAPKKWTKAEFSLDAITRTKNKDEIVGVAISLGVKGVPADYYIDDLTAIIGEAVTDEQLATPVIEAINGIPAADDVKTYGDVMKVLTAKGAFDALSDGAKQKVTNAEKLEESAKKAEGYGLLFDSGNELFTMTTTSGAGYDWSGNMYNVTDEVYGGVINLDVLSVGSGNIIELNHGAFKDAKNYDKAIFCVYNPTKTEKTLLYATGQGWSGKTTAFKLLPECWTEISVPVKTLNAEGGYLLIQFSKVSGWKFSSILGITVKKRAEEVKTLIAALPEISEITEADKDAVLNAKASYDELSDSAKTLVDNYDKLFAELKILVYAEETAPIVELISTLPEPENVTELTHVLAVEKVRERYDELSDGAKECVENVEKLERCEEAASRILRSAKIFEGLVNSLDNKTDSDEIIFTVLTAKSVYETLGEDKTAISEETLKKYEKYLKKADGYVLLYDAFVESLLTDPAPGYYTNDSEVRSVADGNYGGAFAMKVRKPYIGGQASFKQYGRLDTKGIAAVTFYVRNDTGAYRNALGVFRNDYGASEVVWLGGEYMVECGLADSVWTKVTIPVNGYYSEDDVYFVLNGAGVNFDGDKTHPVTTGTWLVTSFVGITVEKYNEMLAEETVRLINLLPSANEIKDLSAKTQVYAAKASYDSLPGAVKPFVTNAEKLKACLVAIERIISDEADALSERIAALPEAGDLKAENFAEYRGKIIACANTYDNAPEEVRTLVVGKDKLEELKKKLGEFDPLLADIMIEALPSAVSVWEREDVIRIIGVKAFYDGLTEDGKAQVKNYAKLAVCVEKISGFGIAVKFTENPFGRWDYGTDYSVSEAADDYFGKIYALTFGSVREQSFSVTKENAADYASYALSIYNPLDEEVLINVHGGYNDGWGLYSSRLKAGEWNTIEVPSEWFSVSDTDKIYIILTIPDLEKVFDCVINVSAIIGVTEQKLNEELAEETIAKIAALPEAENIKDFGAKTEIFAAKASYDSLPEAVKKLVYNADKLDACVEAIESLERGLYEKVERLIEVLPSPETIEEKQDFIMIMYAKNAFDSLSEELREKVKNADKLIACVKAAEGYGVVFSPANGSIAKWDYGNALMVSSVFDEKYGDVFSVKTDNVKEQSYVITIADLGDYYGFNFAIYNPTDSVVRLNIHGGYTAWGLYSCDLAANGWTEIALDRSVFVQGDGGKIYLIATAAESVAGEWKISAVVGTPKEKIKTKVVADASDAANLSSGRDTGVASAIGVAADETYGSVWTLNVTGATTDFHATKDIDVTGYGKIVFSVYNPTDHEVSLVLYTRSWGSSLVIKAAAGEWTDIEVDVSVYGGSFFIVIANNPEGIAGEWKVTSFTAIPAENA